jgi:hypothetical protein
LLIMKPSESSTTKTNARQATSSQYKGERMQK